MKSIVGRDQSAKFILFRCDDDSLLPKLPCVKKALGCKTASFYKSAGHYRNEILSMSSALNVISSGLNKSSELSNYYSSRNTPYMTSVLRLDSGTKRNVFFDLQYSDLIVDHLLLTHESLNELENLCSGGYDLINRINYISHLIEKVEDFNSVVNKRKEIDSSVKEAVSLLASDCFEYFGEGAFKHAERNFSNWYEKVKWNTDN
jgi:hypothetical protein